MRDLKEKLSSILAIPMQLIPSALKELGYQPALEYLNRRIQLQVSEAQVEGYRQARQSTCGMLVALNQRYQLSRQGINIEDSVVRDAVENIQKNLLGIVADIKRQLGYFVKTYTTFHGWVVNQGYVPNCGDLLRNLEAFNSALSNFTTIDWSAYEKCYTQLSKDLAQTWILRSSFEMKRIPTVEEMRSWPSLLVDYFETHAPNVTSDVLSLYDEWCIEYVKRSFDRSTPSDSAQPIEEDVQSTIQQVVINEGINPYDVLKVSRAASDREVREQYLILIKARHPDREQAQESARFSALLNNAYACLKTPEARGYTNAMLDQGQRPGARF